MIFSYLTKMCLNVVFIIVAELLDMQVVFSTNLIKFEHCFFKSLSASLFFLASGNPIACIENFVLSQRLLRCLIAFQYFSLCFRLGNYCEFVFKLTDPFFYLLSFLSALLMTCFISYTLDSKF